MKIGIDARMYSSAGIGRYIKNLISELEKIDTENDYIIFLKTKDAASYHPKNSKFKKWTLDVREYSFAEQTSMFFELLRADLDVFYVANFNYPILYPRKTFITVHDFLMLENSPDASTLGKSGYTVKKILAKIVFWLAVMRSKRVFVPTNYVKDELLKRYKGTAEDKIIVSYEGVDEDLILKSSRDKAVVKTRLEEMKIKDNYILYVGSSYPHKNIKNLIVAYKDLIEEEKFAGQLVLAGKIDEFANRHAGFIHALKLDDKIIFAAKFVEEGRITDRDLAFLYQGATCYVIPSYEEGFSITPLEAQTFGVPVVASDIPPHREILGDSVLYFKPDSNIELSDRIDTLLLDNSLRKDLIAKGYENVKKYSWKNLAQKFIEVIKNK